MNPPAPLELVCPRCQIEVQPIRAAGRWFCPHCAWEFSAEDVERGQNGRKRDGGEPA